MRDHYDGDKRFLMNEWLYEWPETDLRNLGFDYKFRSSPLGVFVDPVEVDDELGFSVISLIQSLNGIEPEENIPKPSKQIVHEEQVGWIALHHLLR